MIPRREGFAAIGEWDFGMTRAWRRLHSAMQDLDVARGRFRVPGLIMRGFIMAIFLSYAVAASVLASPYWAVWWLIAALAVAMFVVGVFDPFKRRRVG